MLSATESGVHIITVMCCTQLVKTALLENLFGYFAHLDPCPILLLQPKEEAAEQFSKERISPLVRVTPGLRNIIGDSKQKSSKETILYKAFTGGFLALAGAGSPDNLARRPIRVLLADEVDKYPITREGDPIALAEERTATFGLNWLSVRACSPTVEDENRIADSYEDSDQRRASVVCPHCRHRQFLDLCKHVQWPKEVDKHLTKAAMIHCECCGAGWSEGERLRALQTIRWHQTKPFECCGSHHSSLMEYDQKWHERDEGSVDTVWRWSESERHAVYRAICPDYGAEALDSATVAVTARLPDISEDITGGGRRGNADAGTLLTLDANVPGIDSSVTLIEPATGGADIENEEDFRQRGLLAFQNPPQGGSDTDYRGWALAVPGVTRAWIRRRGMGPGTVVIYIMCDGSDKTNHGFPVGTDGISQLEE